MLSYEQKLAEFTEGKNLIRLPRPIRDRADVCCDACGSNHPRTLYALKESESNRHYFVGNTCLKELVKLGAILRKFGRESGQSVFEEEMKLRASDGLEPGGSNSTVPSQLELPQPNLSSASPDIPPADSSGQPLTPMVLILESPDHYQAVVSFISSQGVAYGWGSAREPRSTKHWRQGGERGLVLEEMKEENPFASRRCLTTAWHEAISQLDGALGLTDDMGGINRRADRAQFDRPFLTLLRLDSSCAASADFSPNFRMICQAHLRSLAKLGSSL